MKKVKFVQLLTGSMVGTAAFAAVNQYSSWTILYALADDGTVWMWTGTGGVGWAQCGPNPESIEK
jgi:hypothetical protein